MTRFSESANQTGAAESNVFMLVMVHLDFATGDLYLHDGQGTFAWNSVDWIGTGSLGSISAITEAQDDRPKALKLTLSGINSDIMTEAIAADFYGRSCKVYTAFFDENNALLADPELEFEGRMDNVRIDAQSSTVELTCESRLILWSQSNGALYTDEDHQGITGFSGDVFFDQQTNQADQYLEWGVLNTSGNFGGGPNDGIRNVEQ